jgi:hypothetical protein
MQATMLSRWLFSAALFGAGCAIGYFAGLDGAGKQRGLVANANTSAQPDLRPGSERQRLRAARESSAANSAPVFSAPIPPGTHGEALVGAFAQCLLERSDDERHAAWLGLLRHLTTQDAPAVCALFRKLGPSAVPRFAFEYDSLERRWGQIDGAGAMNYLEYSLDENRSRPIDESKQRVMFGWAQKAPDAARRWLADHQAEIGTNGNFEALTGYIDARAREDYRDATRVALVMVKPDHENASQITSILADQALLQGGVQGLVDWFEQMPNDNSTAFLKKLAAADVVSYLQEASPARAMDWISQHNEPAWRDDDAIGTTADRVATTIDPQTALNWLTSLPRSTNGGSYPGMNRVLRQFAAKDTAGLDAWIREPKSQEVQDQALAAYARILRDNDPARADQLTAQIQDPRWRQSTETLDFVVEGALQRSVRVIHGGDVSFQTAGPEKMTIKLAPAQKP